MEATHERTQTRGKKRKSYYLVAITLIPGALLIALTLITGCGGGGSTISPDSFLTTDSVLTPDAMALLAQGDTITRSELGSGLRGLSPEEATAFADGLTEFNKVETIATGLGPVFNGKSCAECHVAGAIGGAGLDKVESVVRRIGAIQNGHYTDLVEKGGPVLQRRSIKEIDSTSPVLPEIVPAEAQFVSERMTTPLFGMGLIEAIPDATIEALADPNDRNHDGISGRVNHVINPETGKTEIGRFGWKAQISALHVFVGDAYLNEMGITTDFFPKENAPQGIALPVGADTVSDPEDDADGLTPFMRFLAPPQPAFSNSQTERGSQVFQRVGCVSCHVPTLATGPNASPALSRKRVNLYSDLLLHDMGRGLADGIQQGEATGSEFRTAPLWGLSQRKFFLHNGSVSNLPDAIASHGGEATQVVGRYQNLPSRDKQDLLAFLSSL